MQDILDGVRSELKFKGIIFKYLEIFTENLVWYIETEDVKNNSINYFSVKETMNSICVIPIMEQLQY